MSIQKTCLFITLLSVSMISRIVIASMQIQYIKQFSPWSVVTNSGFRSWLSSTGVHADPIRQSGDRARRVPVHEVRKAMWGRSTAAVALYQGTGLSGHHRHTRRRNRQNLEWAPTLIYIMKPLCGASTFLTCWR